MPVTTQPSSGIPRPSTYTLKRQPSSSAVLAPSGRNNVTPATGPAPLMRKPTGIPTPSGLPLPKYKSALTAPAVRPSRSTALLRSVPTSNPPLVTSSSHLAVPPALHKTPSLRSLPTAAAAADGSNTGEAARGGRNAGVGVTGLRPSGGLQRKASRPSLKAKASRPSLGKSERILVPPPQLKHKTSRPSLGKAERIISAPQSQRATGIATPSRTSTLRPAASTLFSHASTANVHSVPAIPPQHLTKGGSLHMRPPGQIRQTVLPTPASRAVVPSAIPLPPTPHPPAPPPAADTPFMPRIRRISRPWDSSISYSPLNNVQLSFDAELDSDMEEPNATTGRLLPPPKSPRRITSLKQSPTTATEAAELRKRIAELESRVSEQDEQLLNAKAERDAAGREQIERASAARAAALQRVHDISRQYENALEWGMTIRNDITAQLELIRTIKISYA